MMKYSTYTWDLVRALESASPASCKTPATFNISINPWMHENGIKYIQHATKENLVSQKDSLEPCIRKSTSIYLAYQKMCILIC